LVYASVDASGQTLPGLPVMNQPWDWVESIGDNGLGDAPGGERGAISNNASLSLERFAARATGDTVRSEKTPRGFHDALGGESVFARDWAETRIPLADENPAPRRGGENGDDDRDVRPAAAAAVCYLALSHRAAVCPLRLLRGPASQRRRHACRARRSSHRSRVPRLRRDLTVCLIWSARRRRVAGSRHLVNARRRLLLMPIRILRLLRARRRSRRRKRRQRKRRLRRRPRRLSPGRRGNKGRELRVDQITIWISYTCFTPSLVIFFFPIFHPHTVLL
jgi:hypothetical protein